MGTRKVGVLALLCLSPIACQQGPANSSDSEDAAVTAAESAPATGLPCAPGTNCIRVTASGSPSSDGTYFAQCSSPFPDFVQPWTSFPVDYGGPWFAIAADFPIESTTPSAPPWSSIDFEDDPDAYLYALRDYAYDGMIEADFRPADNQERAWFHVPLMNFANGSREFVHGLTKERNLVGPELGIKPGTTVNNYAIGFYNEIGGYTVGQVWNNPSTPDISASQFEEGSMVFKILFTAATCDDFSDPDPCIVDGAPEWEIATGSGTMTTVRLLQMDVATRDDRSTTSGWVYGTFAFDTRAGDENPWNRMRPVGLMWGDDAGATPTNGQPIEETLISDEAPAYARTHLGWAGRLNGPVDNPDSACLSCHNTAQYPIDAALGPFGVACDTDEKKLQWFRDLAVGEAFGAVNAGTCELESTPPLPPPVSLDTSLQIKVSVQNVLQYEDSNPCATASDLVSAEAIRALVPTPRGNAPRVSRGQD